MNSGLNTRFKEILISFFAGKIVFLGPDEILLYRYKRRTWIFEREIKNDLKSDRTYPKHAVLVVGRELYFEMNHTFPITAYKDVAKAVGLQAPILAPQSYSRHTCFPHKHQKKTLINLWFFYPDLQEWINRLKPLAIFPETALLGLFDLQKGHSLCYGRRWNHFILCFKKQAGDLLSRLFPGDLGEKEAILEFKRLAGYETVQAKEIFSGCFPGDNASKTDYFSALCREVQDLSLKWWPRFFCWERFRPKRVSRPFIYFGVAVLILFFLLPMFFSLEHTHSVNTELNREEKKIAKQVGRYLKMKMQVENKTTLLEELKGPLLEYVPRTKILSELGRLLHPPGDSLSSFRLTGRRFEIRGETESSSEFLGRLNRSEAFSEVRLSSPVIKDKKTNKERFVIEVLLAKP